MSFRDRLRSMFRLFLLFTVLVAVALLSAITTIRLTIHGRQENMPRLVGIPMESAQRIAVGLDLALKVEDKVYSTQYAANEIAQQMPPPGTPLKMGQHVHVLVSLGPPVLKVPNLLGDSERAARITATQRGMTVGEVIVLPWQSDPDQVVAQDPAPSTTEVRTPTVNLLVSGGEEPRAYLCPRFIGRPLGEARRVLEKNGFKVGQVTTVPMVTPAPATGASPGTVPTQPAPGTVLIQSPPAGSKIGPDAVFSFQVVQ